MPFEKGKSGNPGGRPAGNKPVERKAREQREFLQKLLLRHRDRFEELIGTLSDKEFMKLYMEMLIQVTPRLRPTLLNETPDLETFLRMTSEERTETIQELSALLNHGK